MRSSRRYRPQTRRLIIRRVEFVFLTSRAQAPNSSPPLSPSTFSFLSLSISPRSNLSPSLSLSRPLSPLSLSSLSPLSHLSLHLTGIPILQEAYAVIADELQWRGPIAPGAIPQGCADPTGKPLFAKLSAEPIASASLGQVYRGTTHKGEEVNPPPPPPLTPTPPTPHPPEPPPPRRLPSKCRGRSRSSSACSTGACSLGYSRVFRQSLKHTHKFLHEFLRTSSLSHTQVLTHDLTHKFSHTHKFLHTLSHTSSLTHTSLSHTHKSLSHTQVLPQRPFSLNVTHPHWHISPQSLSR